MKTEEGIVIEVIGNLAKIKAGKHNDCKDCGACPGNDSAIVTAKNEIVAKPGQRVNFEVQELNEVKGAFIVFVLPLIGIFMGIVLGSKIGQLTKLNQDVGMVIGGLMGFLSSIAFIKSFDKSVSKNDKSLPVIISIVK